MCKLRYRMSSFMSISSQHYSLDNHDNLSRQLLVDILNLCTHSNSTQSRINMFSQAKEPLVQDLSFLSNKPIVVLKKDL